MAESRASTLSGYRAGFVFVVCLLAAVSGFTLYAEIRTNEKVDALVSHALERHELIGRIRVDALNLEGAVDDHIRGSDAERLQADELMTQSLDDIRTASQEYTQALPEGERELWKQFNSACQALALQVHTAVNYSNRKLAERARQHLVETIRPITSRVDELANQLSEKNAEETRQLLRKLEELRFNTTLAGTVVALFAVVIALLVGWSVSSLVQKQEQTIHQQMAELDSRNRELDAFASRVAHDLVSPLAPLKGYLTLIRRSHSVSDPPVLEMLSLAEASAERMAELIEALLRFCRAGIRSEQAVADLDTAVSTILLELSQTADSQGVKLERKLEGPVPVACSAQLLQSIAQNVLSNAVKYTAGRPEPKVLVRVAKERNEAVLEVTDNGSGMSESSQKSLFQPFFRAPEARGLPGHGLGMATTKRLVEAHGGSIQVQSQLSVGTQVFVRFPLSTLANLSQVNPS